MDSDDCLPMSESGTEGRRPDGATAPNSFGDRPLEMEEDMEYVRATPEGLDRGAWCCCRTGIVARAKPGPSSNGLLSPNLLLMECFSALRTASSDGDTGMVPIEPRFWRRDEASPKNPPLESIEPSPFHRRGTCEEPRAPPLVFWRILYSQSQAARAAATRTTTPMVTPTIRRVLVDDVDAPPTGRAVVGVGVEVDVPVDVGCDPVWVVAVLLGFEDKRHEVSEPLETKNDGEVKLFSAEDTGDESDAMS